VAQNEVKINSSGVAIVIIVFLIVACSIGVSYLIISERARE